MEHSIQDYARKINSVINGHLNWLDVSSLVITALFLLTFTVFLYMKKGGEDKPVSYITSSSSAPNDLETKSDSRPFVSINGKTYTFSWCNGSSNISAKNKIYFTDESEAVITGRVLSKLCQK